jgi:transcriptional regulator with XRE-family HTH domain
MSDFHWWSRYGDFSPGEGILPHMGEVIANYRKKRYRTQTDFAIAAGVVVRTVQEWETSIMTHDHERRIFLAKMLKIPPALLGLDWRLVFYEDNIGTHSDPAEHLADILEEDTYYHYEDTLVMAWDMNYSGRLLTVADRFDRRLRKLRKIVENVPEADKEAWLSLLGQFYHLATYFTEYSSMDGASKKRMLYLNALSMQIAKDVNDVELLSLSLLRRAGTYLAQEKYDLARQTAQSAMEYIERVRTPLRGNIILKSAEVHAKFAAHDETLAKQIRQWQDKALNTVYKGKIEPDRSFLKLNLAGVHHERAKTLLQFHTFHPDKKKLLADAQNEMHLAWGAFTPDLAEWRTYFLLTDAKLYGAEHDLEGSARTGLEALKAARSMQSKKGEAQVKMLYEDLNNVDEVNPYVRNLGLELGIF